jgi:hypothetical protein
MSSRAAVVSGRPGQLDLALLLLQIAAWAFLYHGAAILSGAFGGPRFCGARARSGDGCIARRLGPVGPRGWRYWREYSFRLPRSASR